MKPTEELMHEHEIILHMLSGAERLAQSIVTTHTVDTAKVKNVIDFSRHFTDGCHHSKEEKHLFVRFVEKGMPKEQGPIAVMLNEHRMGRDLILQIETALQEYQSGKKEASDSVGQSMLRYVELLRAHIAKENNILFPMGDRLLSADDQQFLEKSFKIVEEQEIGAGVHEKYHRMAHEIAE
jgi:hemerythrin-like domain-containing protein